MIGLCGGIGSGKGTVAAIFRAHGIPTMDTDEIYHEITAYYSDCLAELEEHFGSRIVSDNALDRRALSKIVFDSHDSKALLSTLNSITHKYVLAEVRKRISKLNEAGEAGAVVEIPLLFECGFDKECDVIIAVVSEKNTRLKRIISRDSISLEDAERRLDSQHRDDFLISRSDYVIHNDLSIYDLEIQVKNLIKEIF